VTTSIAQLVARHPLLAGLDENAVAQVAGCARNVAFEPGRLLLAEGDRADTLYLVRRGHVAIEVHAPGRGSVVLETVGPGSVVGWSWLIPPYRWSFDARARDDVGAIAIDGACLRHKAQADPELGFALLSRVSSELLSRLQATRLRLLDLYGSPHDH
jgi:CRP-like cAMP-binding protein